MIYIYIYFFFLHIFWIPQANVREVYQSLVGEMMAGRSSGTFQKGMYTLYAFISLIVNKLG